MAIAAIQNLNEKQSEKASSLNPFQGMSNLLDSKFSNVFSIKNDRIDINVNPFSQIENIQQVTDNNTSDNTYDAFPNSVFDISSNQYEAFNMDFRDNISGGLFYNS